MTQSTNFASLLALAAIISIVNAQPHALTSLDYSFAASISQTTITADNAVTLTPRPYTTINIEAGAEADTISAYFAVGAAVSSSTEYRQNQPSVRFVAPAPTNSGDNIASVKVGGERLSANERTLTTTAGSDNTVEFTAHIDDHTATSGVLEAKVLPFGPTQQSLNGVTHVEAGVGYNLSDSMSIGVSYTRDNLTIDYNENIATSDGVTITPTAKSEERIASSFNLTGRFNTDIGNNMILGARMNYGLNPSLERLGNLADLDTNMSSFTVGVAYNPS